MNDGLGPEGSYYEAQRQKEERKRRAKSDAVYPLVITAVYLILGFCFHAWHPGWLVFLTIPLHYMHFHSIWDRLANPVMVTLIYLVLGCVFGLWHPGWIIFLIIPIAAILNG